MMKDKEWLKDKIKDEERNLKYVYDNYVPYENVLIADDVYDLIDQLDEPEITEEQAWNEEIARLSDYLLRNFEKEIGGDRNYETPVDAAIRLLGEKRKPVIPQFVANYIETLKKNDFDLALCIYDGTYGVKVSEWLFDAGDEQGVKNRNLIMRAWLDGYEVEKEKLYRVRVGKSYVRFNLDGSIVGAKAVNSVVTLDHLSKLPFDYKKAVESGIITLVEVAE